MTRTKKSLLFLSSLALGIFLFASYSEAETTATPESDTEEEVNSGAAFGRPAETKTSLQPSTTPSDSEDLSKATNSSTTEKHEEQPADQSPLEEVPTNNKLNPVSQNPTHPLSENIPNDASPSVISALSPSAQTRLLNLSANLSNRYDAALWRLEKIVQRLEKRLVKVQQQGHDTSLAEKPLERALNYLQEAKTALKNIDTQVSSFVYAKNPALEWPKVKNTYTNTHTLLTNAKQNLEETITLLNSAPVQTNISDEPSENPAQNLTNHALAATPEAEREDEENATKTPSPTNTPPEI